jgi:hypothetical protein
LHAPRTTFHFVADGIAKSNVRDDAVAEESIDAVPGAIEELVGDHEIERLVLFLQRSHGRNRNNALHSQLLKAVNVGAEIQFAGEKFVAAGMAREKRHLAALERAQNVGIRRIAKGSLLLTSCASLKPGMWYRPLPPIMPISACCKCAPDWVRTE